MTANQTTDNRRILVIDDNVNIHEDFRSMLALPKDSDLLSQTRTAVFGEVPILPPPVQYELDFASQGQEGFNLVQTAHRRGMPYAVAFVDMRMPPGWDGLETIKHLWSADPDIHIVMCTAYSDHSWEDVSRGIGETDKLLILMKPFSSMEVVQLAKALTKKWNLARAVTLQVEILALSVTQRTAELQKANERLHERVAGQAVEDVTSQSQGDVTDAFRQKEEFLAIMSHEISVPMNELISKVALLLDSTLTPEQREQMATIQRCAQDVRTLLGDMHEFMAGRRPETRVEHRQ